MPAEVLVPLAVALVIGGWWWRRARTARAVRSFRAALAAPDETARLEALRVVSEEGLSLHAGPLLALAHRETSLPVQAALVDLVARHQWEPVTSREMANLRQWAAAAAPRLRDLTVVDPGAARGTVEAEVPLVDAVERALGERVAWMSLDGHDGALTVHRSDPEGSPGGRSWD